MKHRAFVIWLSGLGLLAPIGVVRADEALRVGSKKFTENVILGDMATFLVRESGASAVHVRELGGTRILWSALLKGDIDIYPEYTGTITHEIFAGQPIRTRKEILAALEAYGVKMSRPLGFNNTYAIGVPKPLAEKLRLNNISDLVKHPDLRFGFSNEFMERSDGWPGLKARYRLPQTSVTGLDHDIAYRGIENGSLDVVDLYATDAEIPYYKLKVLTDDLSYFPAYDAVFLYKAEAVEGRPGLEEMLLSLEGKISAETMSGLNYRSKFDKLPARRVAADFLKSEFNIESVLEKRSLLRDLKGYTYDHLYLVVLSLLAAIVVALPLGIAAAKIKWVGRTVLPVVGVVQTIPSLALLVFMIPLLGIGSVPAVVALFLYSLLPIVRNTYQGILGVDRSLNEAAVAIGLPAKWRLLKIELPLAAGAVLAGIKTAAVINIGTATLGALIGAGGYGQPILTGIRLDDTGLILLGAVPAAVMALVVSGLFDVLERLLVLKTMRS